MSCITKTNNNVWIAHVKKVAEENGISYKKALPIASKTYKKMVKVKKVPTGRKVATGRGLIDGILEAMPKNVKLFLRENGEINIKDITIHRYSLIPAIKSFLTMIYEGVTNPVGQFPYDKLYHLFLRIELEDGRVVRLDKFERVNIVFDTTPKRPDEESMKVRLPPQTHITLNSLFDQLIYSSKGTPIWQYRVATYNCQDFVKRILKHSNLLTPPTESFIFQPLDEILPKSVSILTNTVTDIAALIDSIMQGGKK